MKTTPIILALAALLLPLQAADLKPKQQKALINHYEDSKKEFEAILAAPHGGPGRAAKAGKPAACPGANCPAAKPKG